MVLYHFEIMLYYGLYVEMISILFIYHVYIRLIWFLSKPHHGVGCLALFHTVHCNLGMDDQSAVNVGLCGLILVDVRGRCWSIFCRRRPRLSGTSKKRCISKIIFKK